MCCVYKESNLEKLSQNKSNQKWHNRPIHTLQKWVELFTFAGPGQPEGQKEKKQHSPVRPVMKSL